MVNDLTLYLIPGASEQFLLIVRYCYRSFKHFLHVITCVRTRF